MRNLTAVSPQVRQDPDFVFIPFAPRRFYPVSPKTPQFTSYRCSSAPAGLLVPWISVWQFWHARPIVCTASGPLVRP